jgi:hypothetical protein
MSQPPLPRLVKRDDEPVSRTIVYKHTNISAPVKTDVEGLCRMGHYLGERTQDQTSHDIQPMGRNTRLPLSEALFRSSGPPSTLILTARRRTFRTKSPFWVPPLSAWPGDRQLRGRSAEPWSTRSQGVILIRPRGWPGSTVRTLCAPVSSSCRISNARECEQDRADKQHLSTALA